MIIVRYSSNTIIHSTNSLPAPPLSLIQPAQRRSGAGPAAGRQEKEEGSKALLASRGEYFAVKSIFDSYFAVKSISYLERC